jgi:hypothetical protein
MPDPFHYAKINKRTHSFIPVFFKDELAGSRILVFAKN